MASKLFKLIIEGENFPENVHRELFYTKPWDKENREDRLRSKIFTEKCVYLPNVKYIERSKKRIVSLELIKEVGFYCVSMSGAEEGLDRFMIAVQHPLALGGSVEGQETPGAWGKVKEFFKKCWKWLIHAIASIIGRIIVPIINLIVKK